MGTDQSAADVFGLLSDETRVDILRAVARAQTDTEQMNAGPAELAFSDIYDRVDVDNSSKLSYHLTELAGTFLRKGENGYSFTHAGEQITRFILAENFERLSDFEPIETAGTCPFCGATSLEARLHHQFFFVRCRNCERPVAGHPITPAQARSRDESGVLRAVKQKQAIEYGLIRRGICPECAGPLDTELRDIAESPLPDADTFLAIDRCGECLRRYNALLTYGVAYHPASVAFHWDRGIDVLSRGMWEFHDHLAEGRWTSELVSTDPDEYEVVLRRGDDALRCRLDSSATVTRTELVRRREASG